MVLLERPELLVVPLVPLPFSLLLVERLVQELVGPLVLSPLLLVLAGMLLPRPVQAGLVAQSLLLVGPVVDRAL